jgi:tocopherol O-methyltransferase
MNKDHKTKVRDYYDDSQILYRLFWMNRENLAMHYGLWGRDTRTLHEALMNENEYVGNDLKLTNSDVVLDAGCGVGGTAIWIAEKYNAKIVGINIVEKQIKLARKYAKRRGVDNLVSFELKDYCNTGFPDESFDKIYALESVCHASNKEDFVKEASRLLKPGGKLCVYDYFVNKVKNKDDEKRYNIFCEGWAMPGLATNVEFEGYLTRHQFGDVCFANLTEMAMESSRRISKSAKKWLWVDKTLNVVKITTDENVISTAASVAQYPLFRNNTLFYGSFYAEKIDK